MLGKTQLQNLETVILLILYLETDDVIIMPLHTNLVKPRHKSGSLIKEITLE